MDVKNYKSIIFKLDRDERTEKDINKRKELLLDLKQRIENVLEILPDDLEMQTKLMYVYIRLNDINQAKKIGYELLERIPSKDVLNGLSIIEEKARNYDKSIEFINKMLEMEPHNQWLKKKKERIENKKNGNFRGLTATERMYRKIGTLERSIRKETEEYQTASVMSGEKLKTNKALQDAYVNTYKKVKEIANEILAENPEEITAREKLVKSLFIIGEFEEAEQEAKSLLEIYNSDEIGLWYLSKIERERGNFEKEKEYLEEILENSPEGTQINVQKRLERVKQLIERQKEKQQLKEGLEENYTEETRQEFIDRARQDFIYGNLRLSDIEKLIDEARKYPNFVDSLIVLLDMKSKITEDKQSKIDELESYMGASSSITREEYKNILDEIAYTRREIEEDNMIEQYWDKKKREESRKQREYSKYVIDQLGKGKVKEDDIPKIVKQLEQFKDRTRSIFLITKVYEILYGKGRAANELMKYTYIVDLTPEEQRGIEKMQKILSGDNDKKGEETPVLKESTPDEQGGDSGR